MLTLVAVIVFLTSSIWNATLIFVLMSGHAKVDTMDVLHTIATFSVWFIAGVYLFGLY